MHPVKDTPLARQARRADWHALGAAFDRWAIRAAVVLCIAAAVMTLAGVL